MELPQIEDYQQLFLDNTPLLDVRAPVEFDKGNFPSASNCPLLDDQQREKIGIRYKNQGQEAAVQLGKALVNEELKQQRIAAWQQFAREHKSGALYCFRGGMRSQISQQWLYEQTGIIYPRIRGGYKAMRQYLIESLTDNIQTISPIVLGGRSGSGKTLLVKRARPAIDLEGLARHRGSAFGPRAMAQPNQIDFENKLAIEMLQLVNAGYHNILMEDEYNHIGACSIPYGLPQKLKASPLVILEASLEQRIQITHQEYITEGLAEYQQCFGPELGFDKWAEYVRTSLAKIKKRLGLQRYELVTKMLEAALVKQMQTQCADDHDAWIRLILTTYYDPMYDYQIAKNNVKIAFSGEWKAVTEFLSTVAIDVAGAD